MIIYMKLDIVEVGAPTMSSFSTNYFRSWLKIQSHFQASQTTPSDDFNLHLYRLCWKRCEWVSQIFELT